MRLPFQGLAFCVSSSIRPTLQCADNMYLVVSPVLLPNHWEETQWVREKIAHHLSVFLFKQVTFLVFQCRQFRMLLIRASKWIQERCPLLILFCAIAFIPFCKNCEMPESSRFIFSNVTLPSQDEEARSLSLICFQEN